MIPSKDLNRYRARQHQPEPEGEPGPLAMAAFAVAIVFFTGGAIWLFFAFEGCGWAQ